MRTLAPADLRARLEEEGPAPVLLDVRDPWEYGICTLEGARQVPMSRLPQVVGELDPGQETIVYCHEGIKSRQVALWLERSGFENVADLAGGIDAWAREIDPDMPTY